MGRRDGDWWLVVELGIDDGSVRGRKGEQLRRCRRRRRRGGESAITRRWGGREAPTLSDCSPFFCDGPKYLYKFIALLPNDYYLIPSNNAMKLVCCVPYLLYSLKAVSLRVNHFVSSFDTRCCKCTGRTSSKLNLSPDIVPTEISRILNQLP